MSFEIHSVQRIRAFVEATFAADSSASAGSFTDLPIIEGSANLTLTRDELDPGFLVQHIDEGRERVLGKRSATLSFTMNIAPTGTVANNGVTSVTSGLGLMLKAVMGGEDLGEGSQAQAGTTSTVVNVQAGDGVHFTSGNLMGWTNSSGIVEWREVEDRSTDAITLKRAFSGTPATNDQLFNASSYHMTAAPAQTLAMIVEGLETDDRWLLTGGQAEGGIAIALDPTGAQLPRITFNLTFSRWFAAGTGGETGTPLSSALAAATFSAYAPIVGEAGRFETWTNGTSTYAASQAIPLSAVSFEPRCQFVRVTSPSGTNTIASWVKARNPDAPVQGSFTTPYEDLTWFNHRNSRTDLGIQYVIGTAAGSSVILSVPTAQVLNPQRVADGSGIAAQTIMFKGRRDGDAGAATTDLAKSPFRLHLG